MYIYTNQNMISLFFNSNLFTYSCFRCQTCYFAHKYGLKIKQIILSHRTEEHDPFCPYRTNRNTALCSHSSQFIIGRHHRERLYLHPRVNCLTKIVTRKWWIQSFEFPGGILEMHRYATSDKQSGFSQSFLCTALSSGTGDIIRDLFQEW